MNNEKLIERRRRAMGPSYRLFSQENADQLLDQLSQALSAV